MQKHYRSVEWDGRADFPFLNSELSVSLHGCTGSFSGTLNCGERFPSRPYFLCKCAQRLRQYERAPVLRCRVLSWQQLVSSGGLWVSHIWPGHLPDLTPSNRNQRHRKKRWAFCWFMCRYQQIISILSQSSKSHGCKDKIGVDKYNFSQICRGLLWRSVKNRCLMLRKNKIKLWEYRCDNMRTKLQYYKKSQNNMIIELQ